MAPDKELIAPLFQWKFNGLSAGNGWNSQNNNAKWGTDYLDRAAMSKSSMHGNKPYETKSFYREHPACAT